MTQPTRLFLIRHGETEWNLQRRLQGQQDSPLTPVGLEQARSVAAELRAYVFDALYCSDLPRAVQTAGIIGAAIGRPPVPDPRLRERHYGIFEGQTVAEIQARMPAEWERYRSGGADYVVPSGESSHQAGARVLACLRDLGARHPGARVCVVTHGGGLTRVFKSVLGIPYDLRPRFSLRNTAINIFSCDDQGLALETWGAVHHLEAGPSPDDL